MLDLSEDAAFSMSGKARSYHTEIKFYMRYDSFVANCRGQPFENKYPVG